MSNIGDRVKQRREEIGITACSDLAACTGLSASYLYKIENGDRDPTICTIEKLANALQCSPTWLAFGAETISNYVDVRDFARETEVTSVELVVLKKILKIIREGEF